MLSRRTTPRPRLGGRMSTSSLAARGNGRKTTASFIEGARTWKPAKQVLLDRRMHTRVSAHKTAHAAHASAVGRGLLEFIQSKGLRCPYHALRLRMHTSKPWSALATRSCSRSSSSRVKLLESSQPARSFRTVFALDSSESARPQWRMPRQATRRSRLGKKLGPASCRRLLRPSEES